MLQLHVLYFGLFNLFWALLLLNGHDWWASGPPRVVRCRILGTSAPNDSRLLAGNLVDVQGQVRLQHT